MTVSAVVIHASGHLALKLATVLVLMRVVTEVQRGSPLLMLAIVTLCRPRHLEWHDDQEQQQDKVFQHGIIVFDMKVGGNINRG